MQIRLRVVIAVMTFCFVLNGANAERLPDDQQTDPAFIQSCLPLVQNQWQRHGFHNLYTETHVIYAQTGPDFISEWPDGSKSKRDYQVPVAFLRKDGQYDLAVLLCHIDHNGKDSIDSKTPQPIMMSVIEEIEGIAKTQLPGRKMHSWVDASAPVETLWPTPQACEQVKTEAKVYCSRMQPGSGCNHPGCGLDIYSYCLNQEITSRGCTP